MNNEQLTSLKELDYISIEWNISWNRLTTLGVGTTAKYVVEPKDENTLRKIIIHCHNNNIDIFVIGMGSNIVGADNFSGALIIKLPLHCMNSFDVENGVVAVGSTMSNASFVTKAFENNLGGVTPLSFIPGEIGGSLRMNAGAHGTNISDYLVELEGLDYCGNKITLNKDDVIWGYRTCSITRQFIITKAFFKLPKFIIKEENDRREELIRLRKETNATGKNAGCIFKNPSIDTSAGKLIDISGCKGLSIGDASVSFKHANFLVNNGDATEQDFTNLMLKVQNLVFNNTGIYLQPEVQFVDGDSRKKLLENRSTVAVLKGGISSEREVSLESGEAVANALRSAGYKVIEIDVSALEITSEMRKADVVFPVLHGGFGENGELQKLMETNNIEFVGCGSKACETIMDKVLSKGVMDTHAIKGAKDVVLTDRDSKFPDELKLPVVTKPPKDGSSFGISLVTTHNEWDKAVQLSYKYDDRLLVEEYIDGVELTVGVIDGKSLPAVEIDYPGMMYDFDAKYTHEQGETFYHCPPKNISPETHKRCQDIAVKFYNAVGARDITRVDMMVDNKGEIHVLEGNNLPGFTASSLLPKSAKQSGYSFVQLCAKLAHCAIKRKNI